MIRFDHFNFNVRDLERSAAFYKEALGLVPVRRVEREGYTLLFLAAQGEEDGFRLELTWLHDRTDAYDLGEGEFHLAMRADDFEALHEKHQKMGCICNENGSIGVYFIEDPDGYWIEMLPPHKTK